MLEKEWSAVSWGVNLWKLGLRKEMTDLCQIIEGPSLVESVDLLGGGDLALVIGTVFC